MTFEDLLKEVQDRHRNRIIKTEKGLDGFKTREQCKGYFEYPLSIELESSFRLYISTHVYLKRNYEIQDRK